MVCFIAAASSISSTSTSSLWSESVAVRSLRSVSSGLNFHSFVRVGAVCLPSSVSLSSVTQIVTLMAPKLGLITAGDDPSTKKKPPNNPLTTGGKVALAAWKKDHQKNVPREAPSKPKKVSLPPPGELSEPRMIKTKQLKKDSWSRGKPLTTQEKTRMAEANKKAKGPQTPTPASKKPLTTQEKMRAAEAKKAGKQTKVKPPSMMAVIRSHDASVMRFEKPKDGTGVLYRQTKRAKKWVCDHPGWLSQYGKDHPASLENGSVNDGTGIMDIPAELRKTIWHMAIVETHVFIWPASELSHEQPDLAMVSRQVREEALSVFYGANAFAIDISPTLATVKPPKGVFGEEVKPKLNGLAAVNKWAKTLSEAGWLHHIREWAFSYAPMESWSTGAHRESVEDRSAVVSLCLPRKDAPAHTSPILEIHEDASCLLAGFVVKTKHERCVVQPTPEWVRDVVKKAMATRTKQEDYGRADHGHCEGTEGQGA